MGSSGECPQLQLRVTESHEGVHYLVVCSLAPWGDIAPMDWKTTHMLRDLRGALHDPIKRTLGDQYPKYFGSTPFAHHLGPPGTKSRLNEWFGALASCINTGGCPPEVVALT